MPIILGDKLVEALADLGIVDDLNRVHRVVIDCKVGEPVNVHIEKYGDDRLLVLVKNGHALITTDPEKVAA